MSWSQVETARLRELAGDPRKFSAYQIGHVLGRSKNSVIGRCRRAGITLQYGVLTEKEIQIRRPKHRPKRITIDFLKVAMPELRGLRSVETVGVTLTELRDHHCRYPLDKKCLCGQPYFCGMSKAPDSPWCQGHREICTMPVRR